VEGVYSGREVIPDRTTKEDALPGRERRPQLCPEPHRYRDARVAGNTRRRSESGRRPKCSSAENDSAADQSDSADVVGFFTLAPDPDVELDGLAFRKGLDALTLNIRDVHEQVIASLARDEAKASVCVEELHCALHNYQLTFNTDRPRRDPCRRAYATWWPTSSVFGGHVIRTSNGVTLFEWSLGRGVR
jgi:hypothetical protein